jgi:hypothetical protein
MDGVERESLRQLVASMESAGDHPGEITKGDLLDNLASISVRVLSTRERPESFDAVQALAHALNLLDEDMLDDTAVAEIQVAELLREEGLTLVTEVVDHSRTGYLRRLE